MLLGENKVLRNAACFCATSDIEKAEIRSRGLAAPVAVVPIGVSIPREAVSCQPTAIKRVLFLSRIHPKKGIDLLLRAWSAVQNDFTSWELVICGPDEIGWLPTLRALAKELALERVSFIGARYGAEKEAAYRGADLYVLPTHSENFGITVAEALSYGLPAIVSKGAPWQGLEKNKCGWWIDIGEEPLKQALREAMGLSAAELRAMGARGREWVARTYSWNIVATQIRQTYEWLLDKRNKPEWVS
jgi:glycosyltransferase involved in cell wall biosynthesis